MEKDAYAYIEKIDELGGIIRAIETGYPQKEIADAAYKYQRELDTGIKTIVGVTKYTSEQDVTIPTLKIEDTVEAGQSGKLRDLKRKRNNKAVQSKLRNIVTAARQGDNLMPYIIDAVSEYATLGEICDIFREVYGVYRDPGYF
jgi:methylmalonyl-CoA mutase N-terminal domain/subunit